MSDTRIVYGATCAWWDSIANVARLGSGLPCCPHCRGVLFEVASEREWWRGVDRYEADGHPGYRAYVEWLRGRCLPHGTAEATYHREKGATGHADMDA